MYAFKSILVVLTLGCIICANADELESWGDGDESTEWTWNFQENRLTILRGDGNDYKFWVHDGTGTPGTGVIDNVVVDPAATGDFTLTIMTPTGDAGALNWLEGDLRYAGGTSTVTGVKVDGNLGGYQKEIRIDLLQGSLEVGGSVNSLTIGGWLGSSPDVIHVAGEGGFMAVNGKCAGEYMVIGHIFRCLPAAGDAQRGL